MSADERTSPIVRDYLQLPLASLSEPIRILCKFVILDYRERLYLIYGPVSEYPYHANLLEQFCREQGIPNSWASKPTMLNLFDKETKIRGGGYAEISTGAREVKFGGHSTAYGRFVRADLETILAQHSLVDGFSTVIR